MNGHADTCDLRAFDREKEDLLKSKDVRGELVIVEVNAQHPE